MLFMARIGDLQSSRANTRGASLRWHGQLQFGFSFASLTWALPIPGSEVAGVEGEQATDAHDGERVKKMRQQPGRAARESQRQEERLAQVFGALLKLDLLA